MKKVLVIGGGVYQVPLIKRITEMGHQAYCVDKNPKAPGFCYAHEYRVIDVLDQNACLDYAKEISIDAVMTYGATITLPTVTYVAKHFGLPALPVYTANISKNKYSIKKCLYENGCNVKGSFFELESINDSYKYDFNFPCVIKPTDGSGSKGVTIVSCKQELRDAIKYGLEAARYGTVYCEDYIDGTEYSVEAFVAGEKVYIYGIVKTTFERLNENIEGIEYGHRTPSGLSKMDEERIENEIKKAVKALEINMASVNFDVILSSEDNQPYVIDCGIRIGQNALASHILPFSTGVSIIDNTIKQALGEKIDAKPKRRKCIASRLLIYNPGIIQEIKNVQELIGKDGILDIILRKHVGDFQNEYHDKSDTCGWVICEGNTPEEAESRASIARLKLKEYFVIC